MKHALGAAFAIALGCGSDAAPVSQHEGAAKVAEVAPAPKAPALKMDDATAAVAFFQGDTLEECIQVFVALESAAEWTPPDDAASLQSQSWLLFDEAYVSFQDGDSLLKRGKDELSATVLSSLTEGPRAQFARMMANLSEEKKAKKSFEEFETIWAEMKAIAWPPSTIKKLVESGRAIRVEKCEFPNRIALGSCFVADDVRGENGLMVHWFASRKLYSVRAAHDTDSGMKSCLRIGGAWEAADRDDPQVARERLRQHSESARRLIGQQ